ncbi:hypothetical protein MXB_5487 [Myxobolus squamalis]|nr:hypothetical protein MXB_5487 [Myxobolus squamalis]
MPNRDVAGNHSLLIPSESVDINENVHTDLYEADDLNAGLILQFQQQIDPEDGEIIGKETKCDETEIKDNFENTHSNILENIDYKAPFYTANAQSFNDDGLGGNYESLLSMNFTNFLAKCCQYK